jgi:hypothetical protein
MTLRITVAALVAFLMAAAPAAARDRVHGGSTSKDEPIALQSTSKGDKLKGAVIAWYARCGDGEYFADASRLRVGRGSGPTTLRTSRNARGRFSGTQIAAGDLGDGQVAVLRTQLSGTLQKSSAKGTLRAEVRIVRESNGSLIQTCRTGNISWRASRNPGRIFAGATSQQEPVVVRLTANRQRVSDFAFGWGSRSCQPPGFMRLGDSLRNFRIRAGGRFGNPVSEEIPLDGGGKAQFDYNVNGRVTRTAASGSLSVRVTGTDADGAQIRTCQSGNVSWKAATG